MHACAAPLYAVPDKTNKESVRAIQKSIFTVCLDAPVPRVSDEMYFNKVAAQMLHGGGSRWNSGNRWFDKTLQVHIWSINPVYVHRVDRNPDIYPDSFLYFTVYNWGGRIVWTHLWTCSGWGTSRCFPGGPCCWLYVRMRHHLILNEIFKRKFQPKIYATKMLQSLGSVRFFYVFVSYAHQGWIYNPKSEKVGTVWKTQIKKESSFF